MTTISICDRKFDGNCEERSIISTWLKFESFNLYWFGGLEFVQTSTFSKSTFVYYTNNFMNN